MCQWTALNMYISENETNVLLKNEKGNNLESRGEKQMREGNSEQVDAMALRLIISF